MERVRMVGRIRRLHARMTIMIMIMHVGSVWWHVGCVW